MRQMKDARNQQIWLDRQDGMQVKDIAVKYGLSQGRTSKILSRQTTLNINKEVRTRPMGEWICEGAMADYTNKLVYRCSICGCHFSGFKEEINVYNFCPNCGVRMIKQNCTNCAKSRFCVKKKKSTGSECLEWEGR